VPFIKPAFLILKIIGFGFGFWILDFQDIKATHIAIEAPIQVLLKLSMISLGILDLPGKQFNDSKNNLIPHFI
jgi:hypothetical protein